MDNVQLIACDMDRTLLTDDKEFPPGFWVGLERLRDLGVLFVPASGRPLPTLKGMFERPGIELAYISDNGALVEYQDRIIHRSTMEPEDYLPMIEATLTQTNGVPLLCCEHVAYVLPSAKPYAEEIGVYYKNIEYVEDFSKVDEPVVKCTSYFTNHDALVAYDDVFMPTFGEDYSVTLGGPAWLDVMNPGVTKAAGVEALADILELDVEQLMAFGDAFNDLEMLDAVEHSYAVANAEPEVIERAKYLAPSNQEFGVMVILDELISRRR